MGTTLSAGVYRVSEVSHYETVNEGREDDDTSKQAGTKSDEQRRVTSAPQSGGPSQESPVPRHRGRASHDTGLARQNDDRKSTGTSSNTESRSERSEKTEALGLDPARLGLAVEHTALESDYAGIARRDMFNQALRSDPS